MVNKLLSYIVASTSISAIPYCKLNQIVIKSRTVWHTLHCQCDDSTWNSPLNICINRNSECIYVVFPYNHLIIASLLIYFNGESHSKNSNQILILFCTCPHNFDKSYRCSCGFFFICSFFFLLLLLFITLLLWKMRFKYYLIDEFRGWYAIGSHYLIIICSIL